MKIERTKNTYRNIIFGTISRLYQIIVPFLMRTAMIYYMGIQYVGLNSLFSSILQVLNLAELGVGSAMVYSMYRPIANDDTDTICALMKLYRRYYRIIGLVVLVGGTVIIPVLPYIVKGGELPDGINLYVLYVMNLAATVLSYWLFAYKNSLLSAFQRNDVSSKISLCMSTVVYLTQFVVILFANNYYFYCAANIVSSISTNIVTAFIVNKMFPQYCPKGTIDKTLVRNINQRVRDLFTAKLGNVIVGSADTIVISSFLGLSVLAVYQNYFFILTAVSGVISVFFSAVIAGIGNSLVTDSIEKNYNDLKKFTFMTNWLLCCCCCCFIGLYQPFIKLWVGEECMLPNGFVFLFSIYFYVCQMAMVWATVKDAAGIWHSDRFRPLVGATANLIMNIIMVQFIDLYGILLSTILSYVFISIPWMIKNLSRELYHRSLIPYIKKVMFQTIITAICVVISWIASVCIPFEGIVGLILIGISCLVISNLLQYVVFCKTDEYEQSVIVIKKMIVKD